MLAVYCVSTIVFALKNISAFTCGTTDVPQMTSYSSGPVRTTLQTCPFPIHNMSVVDHMEGRGSILCNSIAFRF